MPRLPLFSGTTALLVAAVFATGGCARLRDHKGYVPDYTLIDTVQPGIDNRASVTKTLGRPSFQSEFDGGRTWYYIARDTSALAFGLPRPTGQLTLAVHFDAAGNVAAVNKGVTLAQVAAVTPSGDKTATLGVHRGFFQELFGNIGRVGAVGGPSGTSTSDNPTGDQPGGN